MSLWFDKTKKRWRIRIRRNGRELVRTLPEESSRASAERQHARMLSDFNETNPMRSAFEKLGGEDAEWNEQVQRWYGDRKSKLYLLLARAKTRDRAAGRHTSLTIEELRDLAVKSRGRCALSGVRFSDEVVGKGQIHPLALSLDRIDSARGYSAFNCRLVCVAINLALGSWGDQTLRKLAYGIVARDFF